LFGSAVGYVFGVTPSAGVTVGSPGEVFAIPDTPYGCQVAQHAAFVADHGVIDLTTGVQMTRAVSTPGAITEYTEAAGTYTFYSTAKAHVVVITYSYTIAAPTGYTTAVLNSIQTIAPKLHLVAFGPGTTGNILGFDFPAVVVPKLSVSMKTGDWMASNLDFTVVQSSPGATIMSIYSGV
jgi:hypothetical protein